MRLNILKILSKQVWNDTFRENKTAYTLVAVMFALVLFGIVSGLRSYHFQQETVEHYAHEVRERWENRNDNNPHRMAHYGYIAFRSKYPLSFFDFGMESFIGNAIFLEAHKQNTANFSEASLSSSLLRFGEISAAMVLQLLLPLLLFFWGFALVAKERENGTLKILLIQGISWAEIIFGKAIGLFKLACLVFVPAFILGFFILLFANFGEVKLDAIFRFLLMSLAYTTYYFICSVLAVLVSANSVTAKSSLTKLIGIWLVFTLVLPKMALVMGQYLHPAPSKVAFDMAIEAEIIKQGDSHNPNDLHYKAMKDSVLLANKVDSTQKLLFNYGGFMMKEGERLSAETYSRHQADLMKIYEKQQDIVRYSALFNPYIAIKNLSMALAGTDFTTYADFQNQAEKYRYNLAQKMNGLQMKFVNNKTKTSADKSSFISKKYWMELPDFRYQFIGLKRALSTEIISIVSILFWLVGLWFFIKKYAQKFKAI